MSTPSRRGFFYKRIAITATTFPSAPQIKIPFSATRILIVHRNLKAQEIISFSFLRPNLDGELFPDDTHLAMDGLIESRVWFFTNQTQNQNAEIRVWAWRGGGV